MSRGQFRPRNQPVRRILKRCKTRNPNEIIDVEEAKDVVIIDDDDDDVYADDTLRHIHSNSPKSEESKSGTSPKTINKSKEHRKKYSDIGPSRNRFGLGSSSESCSYTSDSSSESISSDSTSSDCEIIEDPLGNIREQWERAALKRKMAQKSQFCSEESSLSGSSLDIENGINKVHSNHFEETHVESCSNNGNEKPFYKVPLTAEFDKPIGKINVDNSDLDIDSTTDIIHKELDPEIVHKDADPDIIRKDRDPEFVRKDPDSEIVGKDPNPEIFQKNLDPEIKVGVANIFEKDKTVPIATSSCANVAGHKTAEFQDNVKSYMDEPNFCIHQFSVSPVLDSETKFEHPTVTSNTNERICTFNAVDEHETHVHDGLILDRERHKESDVYRRVAEEEWAARQRELQIQAEEVQRLKRKRKAETLRLLDMEKRQKQRLEEVRELQKKDEETIHLKERIRTDVRRELDDMEMRYRDMASLLRALGIPVKGGPFPKPLEVNAAYKQALLRFHPDRTSRSDIHQQVKSEEIFKLISRLKEKLMP